MNKYILLVLLATALILSACEITQENASVQDGAASYVPAVNSINTENDETDYLHAARLAVEELRVRWGESEQHRYQYQLLREFALKLNTGTVYLSDIVISEVRYTPSNWLAIWDFDEYNRPVVRPVFYVFFLGDDYMDKNVIVEELLAFTGIDENNLYVRAFDVVRQTSAETDYLLVNEEFYRIMRPNLRMHEIATKINSGTTYYHEVIVTSISDRWTRWNSVNLFYLPPPNMPRDRFMVWLSSDEHVNNVQLISEILEFTGLDSEDVFFGRVPTMGSNYTRQVFLQVNKELGELAAQYERLKEFMEMNLVLNTRGDDTFYGPIRSVMPASHGEYWRSFRVWVDNEYYYDNEAFIDELLVFTGIDRDNIELLKSWDLIVKQEVRDELSYAEMEILIALEAYMNMVNAPFRDDSYHNHPVIMEVLPPGFFTDDRFVVRVFDGDLLGFLSAKEITAYLEAIRADIIDMTGISGDSFVLDAEIIWEIIWTN